MKRLLGLMCVVLGLLAVIPVEAGVSYRGTRGLIRSRSADTIGKGVLDFTLSGQYYPSSNDTIFANLPNTPTGGSTAIVDYHFFVTRGTLTYGLNQYAELAANLEVRSWIQNPVAKNGNEMDVVTRGGLGDTQVSGKLALPTLPHVKLGAYGEVNFPTGSQERGFTTDSRDFLVLGLLTFDFTDLNSFVPTRVHVNAGYRWNKNEVDGYGILDPNYPDSSGYWPPAYPPRPRPPP